MFGQRQWKKIMSFFCSFLHRTKLEAVPKLASQKRSLVEDPGDVPAGVVVDNGYWTPPMIVK